MMNIGRAPLLQMASEDLASIFMLLLWISEHESSIRTSYRPQKLVDRAEVSSGVKFFFVMLGETGRDVW